MHNRYIVLIITMLAYLTIRLMQMVLPQADIYIIEQFGLDHRTLGITNSCIYTILGIGYFYQAINPVKDMKKSYLIYVSTSALALSLVAIYSYIGMRSHIILFLTFGLFGFFQCTTWSTVCALMMAQFTPAKDGLAIGIWSTCAELGNIVGFLIVTVFIYYLDFPWQSCLFLASFLAFLCAVGIYSLPQSQQEKNRSQKKATLEDFRQLCSKLKGVVPIYILTEMCLLKILVYGVLMWVPLYLEVGGLKSFSGYIPIAFNIAALFGASYLGHLYTHIQSDFKRRAIFLFVNFTILLNFWWVKHIDLVPQNQWLLVFLLSIMGFTLNGKYNMVVSNQSFKFAEQARLDPYTWKSIFQTVGSFGIGFFQIVIGIVTYQDEKSETLFGIFLTVSIITVIVQIIYLLYLYFKQQIQQITTEHLSDQQLQLL